MGVLILSTAREDTGIAFLSEWGTGASLEEVKVVDLEVHELKQPEIVYLSLRSVVNVGEERQALESGKCGLNLSSIAD